MVLPLAVLVGILEKCAAALAVLVGVGAVAVSVPELVASDQRGAREMQCEVPPCSSLCPTKRE
jgi:hypothetical protein